MYKFTLDPKSDPERDPDPPQRKNVDPDPPKVKRILTPGMYIVPCTDLRLPAHHRDLITTY